MIVLFVLEILLFEVTFVVDFIGVNAAFWLDGREGGGRRDGIEFDRAICRRGWVSYI